jgi:hypothetical protein
MELRPQPSARRKGSLSVGEISIALTAFDERERLGYINRAVSSRGQTLVSLALLKHHLRK